MTRRKPRPPEPGGTDLKLPSRPEVLVPLGAKLRQLRNEQRLTQEEAAAKVGVTYQYLGRVENAKIAPTAPVLVRLALVYGVPFSEIFEKFATIDENTYRFSPADIDEISQHLTALTAIVERIRLRFPRAVPKRARRRKRRRP